MSEDRVSTVAEALRRAAGRGANGTEIAEAFLADATVQPYLTDEYKEATDAAMNYGMGYAAAMLEVAQAEFISATRRLNRLLEEGGLEHLSAKDLPSLESGGSSGGGRSDDEGQGDGGKSDDPVQHVGSPSWVGVLEPTPPLKYLTIKLADGSEAVSLEDADRVRAEYQRFYDFVADNDTSLVDAWHFGENVRAQKIARGEKP